MSAGGGYGAWLDAMHHDPDKTGITLTELNRRASMGNLPDDLDYKIIHGFEDSKTLDVVVFSRELFEKTGCEYEAEVFRVTVENISGTTNVVVNEETVSSTLITIGKEDA